jgi:hypothetical protein
MDADQFRRYADNSIGRACGFGMLAIFTFMFGLAGEPYIAVRAGAILMTLAAVLLYWRGSKAPARNYRETEVWLEIKDIAVAQPKDRLQRLIGGALAESYFWHARVAAYIAVAMWSVALLMWVGHL